MKILVDSNVVIDFLSDREEFSDEASLYKCRKT